MQLTSTLASPGPSSSPQTIAQPSEASERTSTRTRRSSKPTCELRLAHWFGPSDGLCAGLTQWATTVGIHLRPVWVDNTTDDQSFYRTPGSMAFSGTPHFALEVTSATTLSRLEAALDLPPYESNPAADASLLWRVAQDPTTLRARIHYHVLRDDVSGVRCAWSLLENKPEERVALFLTAAAAGAANVIEFALRVQPSLARTVEALPTRNSALHYAALGGHTKTVELLLDGGADPLMRNPYGTPALFDAARIGSAGCIARLTVGDALKMTNAYGDTVLHRLALYGSEPRASSYFSAFVAVQQAANIQLQPSTWRMLLNAENDQRFTALDLAVATNQILLTKAMRDAGARHSALWESSREGTWTWRNMHHGGNRAANVRSVA